MNEETYPFLRMTPEGIILCLHLQPKAAQNRVIGLYGDELKIAVTSPPVEGEANRALIRFLASILDMPKADIIILSGKTSRRKKVLLKGFSNKNEIISKFK
ncbi:MAG: hypothetical protein Kow0090_12090 [Myxococcota bacterium]